MNKFFGAATFRERMQHLLLPFCLVLLTAVLWGADWPSLSGNPQRDGWSRGEKELSKSAIKEIQLLYKYKFDNQARGLDAMTAPIVLGNLISWKGFKELLFIGGSSDVVYSIDADLAKPYFKTQFDYKGDKPKVAPSAVCSGGLTATVVMPGGSGGGRGFGGGGGGGRGRGAAPPAGFGGFGGRGASVWAVGSDGYLRTLRQQDGNDQATPAAKFLPANARVSGLNISDYTIYAATSGECGGNPNALYALDLTSEDRRVANFATNGSGLTGSGGTAIGADGTVYAQIAEGQGEAAGKYNDTVLALAPKELKVSDYFTPSFSLPRLKNDLDSPGATPVVFQWKGKEVVVAGGRDGRIYILDSASLGGADHHTALYQSEPIVAPDAQFAGNGIWHAFASWEDAGDNNARWLYASIRGPAAVKFPLSNGAAPMGAIVAFKVEEQNGKPMLAPQWISRDMIAPAAPATANGLVFALSTGESPRVAKENGAPYTVAEREKIARNATLYVLDGATGKELFSSGNTAAGFSHSGLAVANARVYFSAHDNTLYCYGIPMEH